MFELLWFQPTDLLCFKCLRVATDFDAKAWRCRNCSRALCQRCRFIYGPSPPHEHVSTKRNAPPQGRAPRR